ncbi:MAG: hypothetical protein NC299_18290 [Lachnospiraceae bacterium]|nr:hypothetical protein [Lachnospiraceae bacterium]
MDKRYKLRLKSFDNSIYTDKALRLEHKGIIAVVRNWLINDTSFTAADLAEYASEDEETVSKYLCELDEARYIDRVPYSDEDRI